MTISTLIELFSGMTVHPADIRAVGPVMQGTGQDVARWRFAIIIADIPDGTLFVGDINQAALEEHRKQVLAKWGAWQR